MNGTEDRASGRDSARQPSENGSTAVAAARSAARDRRFARLARSGYVTSGLLHIVLAGLIAIVAIGGNAEADHSGALRAVASKPLGAVVLIAAGIACALLSLWHWGRAVFHRDGAVSRLRSAGSAAVFLVIAAVVLRYAFGARGSSAENTQSTSAMLMATPAGSALLIGLGAGILATAAYHVYKGVARRFLRDLRALPSAAVRRAVTLADIAGYVAKGLVLASMGLLFIVATVQRDPEDSSGLDGAVQALRDQPAGPAILLALAAGLVFYGAYQVIRARYDTMH